MTSYSGSLRRFGRILRRKSLEMCQVSSLPVPDFSNVPQNEAFTLPLEIPGCLYARCQEDFMDQPQMELSLSEELLAGMEAIVNYRLCTRKALVEIPLGDMREDVKSAILKRIQEVESRALVFLTVPPTNSWVCDESEMIEGINMVFRQFLEDAESCLADANALLKSDFVSKGAAELLSPIKPDLPEVLHIPGFNQCEALTLNKNFNSAAFHILSNPDLRVTTSTIKTIIGSACSQITGSDPEHCLNRLNYLLTFFEGSPVRPPGAAAESFRLPQNMGSEFAWYTLIKAALAQAERQFAFSLQSTLPFAAVLAALLGRFPNYVSLFLAQMATGCPILTLYADDADTVFASVNAFEDVDGEMLQSWRGICRLFAAVLLARLPPGFKQRPAYLNPKLLWITIAGVARHKDKLKITSAVLRGLIETGGYVLLKLYKRQARRLFRSLIDAIGDSQSTWELALVTSLEQLLDPETSAKNGHGILFDDFWN
ncbi:hypothetical protein Aperf_G00000032279 [Anoplocephala perfoliata]